MTLARPRAAALNNTRPPLAGAVIVNDAGAQDLDDLIPAMRVRIWADIDYPVGAPKSWLLDGRNWRGRILLIRWSHTYAPPSFLPSYGGWRADAQSPWTVWTPAVGPLTGLLQIRGADYLDIGDDGALYLRRNVGDSQAQCFLDIQASPLIEAPTHELV